MSKYDAFLRFNNDASASGGVFGTEGEGRVTDLAVLDDACRVAHTRRDVARLLAAGPEEIEDFGLEVFTVPRGSGGFLSPGLIVASFSSTSRWNLSLASR